MFVDIGCRRRFNLNAVPVSIKLFRDQQGQTCIDSLPHLGLVRDNSNRTVCRDAQKGIGRECLIFIAASQAAFHRYGKSKQQAAAGQRADTQKLATTYVE